ncbi:neutral ceramidase 2-like isoform X2 [Anneissia japonica]|uniref:neutral ceramidase 2-like isoform X2 n=1 Tax=Anneissia japonica TaxID=1529436 RepID=UPI001425937E|nr:neutral ceramidase 2-like isoform X2 [Anneissia japonica]
MSHHTQDLAVRLQGDVEGSLFWDLVRNAIKEPSKEEIDCHAPKPILLPTGEISVPWKWQPTIVDVQLLRIGQVVIAAVPGEFSTMAGRRLRNAIKETLVENGMSGDTKVTISGLANTYSDYIVTYEEYQVQRYEGASTIYGPHTLQAYIHKFRELAKKIALGTSQGEEVGEAPVTTNYTGFLPDSRTDTGNKYGKVIVQPDPKYRRGATVEAVFACGNPRGSASQMRGQSYMYVEMKMEDGVYKQVFSDADWSTKFEWKRKEISLLGSYGEATLSWNVPLNVGLGTYRLKHYGYYKNIRGKLTSYEQETEEFEIVLENYRRS